jgi:hypothetical protein
MVKFQNLQSYPPYTALSTAESLREKCFRLHNLNFYTICLTVIWEDRGSIPGRDRDLFLFAATSRPALGPAQSPTQCVSGSRSPVIKRPGREVEQSPPPSAEVKNA